MQLAEKKCIPCEVGTEPLSQEEALEMAVAIPEWDIHDKHIERTFKFKDFMQAVEFANRVANIAETEGHHPDLYISWGKAKVELSTHSIHGLSENDFILAAKIDNIGREQ